jgi:hypothetical protein
MRFFDAKSSTVTSRVLRGKEWQTDVKHRPTSFCVLDSDLASMGMNNLMSDSHFHFVCLVDQ